MHRLEEERLVRPRGGVKMADYRNESL